MPHRHRACGGAGLADRAHRSAGRALWAHWRSRRWRFPPSCTAMPGSASCPALHGLSGRGAGFRACLFSVPLSAGRGAAAPARSGGRGRRGIARPRRRARSSSASCCRNCAWPICGGSLLVGLHLLAEYGLYAMIRFDTFTTAIVDQFQSAYNGPAANMLAGVLVLCCLAPAWRWRLGCAAVSAMPASGPAPAAADPPPPRRATLCPCLALPARHGHRCRSACPCDHARALARLSAVRASGAWRTSVRPSVKPWLLAVAGGAAGHAGRGSHGAGCRCARRGGCSALLEACHYYVGSLPGVVVALALVTITVRRGAAALPDRRDALACLCADVPAARAGRPARQHRAGAGRTRAGRDGARAVAVAGLCGGSPSRLAAPGAAAGMALVALGITNELTATLMLAPNGTRTLATEFWSLTADSTTRPRRPMRCNDDRCCRCR